MSLSTQFVHATAKQMVHIRRDRRWIVQKWKSCLKFMSSLSSLWLLKLRIVSVRNHSYQKQWRNFRNQDFQTNLAHLIILDRKMIPTDPRTKRETRSVHHFINNVPQLPSLSSNAGGRWQKIVTCNNNLSERPTTPIHSQQNLSTVHIHHVNPHWGQALRFACRCWLNYAEHVQKNIWSNILSQSETRSRLPWIFPLYEMIQCWCSL